MLRHFKTLAMATALTFGVVQATPAHSKSIFKKLGEKLSKKKKSEKKAAPVDKPYEKTATGYGKGDVLVISLDNILGGTCKRGGGATAYKLSISAILWTKSSKFPSERIGPVEVYSEDIAPLNPRQTYKSDNEIRIPIEQINIAFDELGYRKMVADKPEVIGSTLGIGIDPVGPCSKLGSAPYRGYSFAPPSVYLDFPNPYYASVEAPVLITRKAQSITVLDNDAARLGDAQGSSTKTLATIGVSVEDK